MSQFLKISVGLMGSMLLLGCARYDGPELADVTGTVTMDSQPLASAQVTFWQGKGRPSVGITDSSGHFKLQYTVGRTGALIGEHRIRISTATAQADESLTPERVPAEFNTKSTVTREVKPGSNVFNFDIHSH